ncbi:M14 family zinc carboxypeptidase [Neobacillus drentensis]
MILILLFSGLSFSEYAQASSIFVNPKQVYSYSKMAADIQKLKRAYPNLVTVKVIGKSEYGRNIYAISLGKGPATIFINGSHHAREWMTTTLNMYMLNQYADAYMKNKKINGYDAKKVLVSTTIWFVPMVNPDGVTLQQSGLKAFPKNVHKSLIKMNNGSKNFKRWKANGKGIDLNRQYDAGWNNLKGPEKPSYKNYKGKAPATAAEVKAILNFVKGIDPEVAVSYHSTGKILYWNYKQDSTRYKRDLAYAKKVRKMTGYSLIYNKKATGGGGFTDWFISVKKRPAFTPEISKSVYENSPPLSEFPKAWKENQAVSLFLATEGSKLYNERNYNSLKTKYTILQTQATKLQPYYSSNIKNSDSLKIDKNFTSLYTSVKYESKRLGQQTAKLYSVNQKKLEGYQKAIKLQLGYSEKYFAAINAGEKLKTFQSSYIKAFEAGILTDATVLQQQQLSTLTTAATKTMKSLFGSNVIKIANEKYINPAIITKENTMYEMKRYQLTLQIENLLKTGNISEVQSQLGVLEKTEKDAVIFKEDKMKQFPGKYKFFVKTETMLANKKAAIKAELDKLTAIPEKDL